MSRAFTPGLKVTPRTVVTKLRELPVPGKVLVEEGAKVSATQVVAQAELPGDLIILRLPERMGLETFEVIHGLQVKEGDFVETGDLVCEHAGIFGLLKTRFKSPEKGKIEFVAERTGHVGLRLGSRLVEVSAYIDGTVKKVQEGKSVLIESHAAFAQGIFGVGGERQGKLCVLKVDPDAALDEKNIPADCQGRILIGGASVTSSGMSAAVARGATGIITGAIDDKVLAEYLGYDLGVAITGDEQVPMTVIVTEGFGSLPIAKRTREVLSRFDGAQASINGATQVRAGAMRPEIIISLIDSAKSADQEVVEPLAGGLQIGARIRMIRVPFFGKRGEVVELPQESVEIESGAHTRVLRARLEDSDEIVTVPRANVELI